MYGTLGAANRSFHTIILSYQTIEQRIPFAKPNYKVTFDCSVCWPNGKIPKDKREKEITFCILNSLIELERTLRPFEEQNMFLILFLSAEFLIPPPLNNEKIFRLSL